MGVKLASSGGGSVQINAASTASSFTATLPAATGTVVLDSAAQTLTNKSWSSPAGSTVSSGTAVASTSGTSIDFTGIPSWVKRITVMFNGVSTNGTSNIIVRLGDSGGVETTGYLSQANTFNSSPSGTVSTVGFLLLNNTIAAGIYNSVVQICNPNGNDWVTSGVLTGTTTAAAVSLFAGSKSLSATLDRVQVTTVNGTDTFDAGAINILYE